MADYSCIKGEYPVFDFSSFVPDAKNPFPDNRIIDFITLGPFVLKTKGSFEAEHMYERDKILKEDYLADNGGEKNAVPVLGAAVRNKYYGDEYLYWEKGFIKWDELRFDGSEDAACNPALYATEQRNAVFYAAFYIRCEKAAPAVICYDNSGSTLFVNGKEVDFKPFGRVKGIWTMGYQRPVVFKKGLNLILFKLRPGYIADTMDLSMANCFVFPVVVKSGGLGLTTPTATKAYTGEKGNEKQVFPAFAAAFENTAETDIDYNGEKIHLPAMKKGEVTVFRFEIPSGKEAGVKNYIVSAAGAEGKYYFPVTPYDGFEGCERINTGFHFDTTYHQEQRTYALGAFHITKRFIETLIENPDFKASLSEIDYLHPYYTLYPQSRKVLKEAFSLGRCEAECFYNQPNDLTSSLEAFIRNLIYGQLYHRDVLGRISTVYAPGDVFGHFSQISQVCAKGGCNYIKWGKYMLGVDSLFRHVSPDGASLLHDKGVGRTEACRFGVSACDFSSGVYHCPEAAPRNGDSSWMKKTVSNISFSVVSQLADDINSSAEKQKKEGILTDIEYTSRDITQHHSGVLLTRTDFNEPNGLCENLLITAEKFAAVAFMYGAEYPDKALDKATRQLLCAQHHDSITGTNNEISFIDLMIEYRECAALCADIAERACRFIASGVKLRDRKDCVFVFNPLTWERGGKCVFTLPKGFPKNTGAVLTDIKGGEYPVVIEKDKGRFIAPPLPAMGYSVFRIKSVPTKAAIIRGGDSYIENKRFRLTVDPDKGGTIVSIYDKKEKREIIDSGAASPANAIYVLKEIHDRMEPQHEFYTTGHKLLSSEYKALVASEKCCLYQKLKVRVKLDTVAEVISEITLYKNSDTVDFVTTVEDYQSEDDMFTVAFPLNIRGGAVVYDDRQTPHVSTCSKKFMSFQTHQYASFSGCRALPAGMWFGIGPTVGLNMENAGKINFGMTALIRKKEKALVDISDRILFALTKKGIPVTPYPDTEQHGGARIIHFNEDVYSTDTRIVLATENDGNLYIKKLLSGVKATVSGKIKKALEKKGLACIYIRDNDNAYKKDVDVLAVIGRDVKDLSAFTQLIERQLAEGYIIEPETVICASFPDKADDYGCVLLNRGTAASSVEGKNTLNMMLFHTASFYGNSGMVTGGKELVPEQKTHIFSYSLYPHKGSFREADVYKKAYEFGDDLLAFSDTQAGKNEILSEEKAFLKTPPHFALTAFKAAGFPYANLRKVPQNPVERGFCLRGIETAGVSSKIKIKTGFDILGAESTNLLEENGVPLKTGVDHINFNATAHSIETVALKALGSEKIDHAVIGAGTEAVKKIYVRSWEHDMGAAVMGNLGVAATIEKLPRNYKSEEKLYINAVNNMHDTAAEMEIKIECSDGIKADRDAVKVKLEAGAWEKIPVGIALDSADTEGQVRISYAYDGMEFYDVYEFGYFNPLVGLKIEENSIICTVDNITGQHLRGGLYIASPYETWGSITGDENSFGEISPEAYEVDIEPKETKKYVFSCKMRNDISVSFWAAAKLCVNGRIHFAFDRVKGPRHNIWAHEFISEIQKDKGSIKKLLDM